jgi:hypothetical protein
MPPMRIERAGRRPAGQDGLLQARERLRLLAVDEELQALNVGIDRALHTARLLVAAHDPTRTDDHEGDGDTGQKRDYGSITHGVRRNRLEVRSALDSFRVFQRETAESRDLTVHARELAAVLGQEPPQGELVEQGDDEREHHAGDEHEQHQDVELEPGVRLGE